MKNFGSLHFFLGVEVTRNHDGMFLCQQKYASDLVRACMHQCESIATLLASKSPPLKNGDQPFDPSYFRSIVGALQYLTLTRPDLSLAVNIVCTHACSYSL